MEFIGYAASIIMGVTLGLMGGGGSILTVPIMVYLFQVQPATATGYSLFVVGATALIGSISYFRRGDVDIRNGLSFAIPSFLGVYASRAWIVPGLPKVIATFGAVTLTKDMVIMGTFAILMVIASYSMIKGRKSKEQAQLSSGQRMGLMVLQGLIVGVIAGFVGAGGGFLIIPALVVVAGLHMRLAVGTSLMVISIQSLLGFLGDVRNQTAIDWRLLLTVAGIAMVGIVLGSSLSHHVKEAKLKKGFGWFVLVMGTVILVEQLRHF